MVVSRFGSDVQFMRRVNYQTQEAFGKKPDTAVMGDYPTLIDIDAAYGKGFAKEWLIGQLTNLSLYSNAKNMDAGQVNDLSGIIATEYRHLKVTELLLFFFRFKTGRYGRFYGAVDPMVITCAMRDFMEERNIIISANTKQDDCDSNKEETMTREEWLEIKTITAMYNSEYTVT